MRFGTLLKLAAAAALLLVAAPAAAQTTGGIRGRVANAVSGAALGGVVVVARSPALQGEQLAVSGRDGSFTITFLPPGIYSLRFELEQYRVEQMQNVEVQLGQMTPVALDLVPVSIEAERIVVTGSAPAVDRGSGEIGTNINREFIRATPSARRYSQVLRETPGASSDAYGTTVFGSTSVENTYNVEGLNTTDIGFGRAGADMNTDFFEEIEVKTGGYMPEFGRSTGGIFNLVLQSGSNEFHGDVFTNVSPGFLRADAIPIYRAGDAIGRRDDTTILDVGFDVGGPIIRDRLWFFVGFNPEFRLTTVNRFFQTRYDDATQSGVSWNSDPDFDADEDGVPEPLDSDTRQIIDPGATGATTARTPDGAFDVDRNLNAALREVDGTNEELDRSRVTYMLAGKLTFAPAQDHRLSLAYFGNPYSNSGVRLAVDDSRTTNGVAGEESYYDNGVSFGSHNAILSYQGQLMERRLQVEVFAGAHVEHDVLTPGNAANRRPAVEHIYPTSLSTFEQGCPENDTTPFIDCQVSDYHTGGIGYFNDDTLSRYSAGARFTNLFSGHRVRYGIDTEYKNYDATYGYTGGAFESRYTESAADNPYSREQYSFARVDPNTGEVILLGTNGEPQFRADVSTLTLSAFLQDSWEIDRYFTVNGGLRWDYEQLGGVASNAVVTIPDEFAPRLGFSFDPTGRGKARIFASWGLFYESVPLDINVRAFGRETTAIRYADDAGNAICFDAEGNPAPPGTVPPDCSYDAAVFGGEDSWVVDDLEGQYHQEFVAGAEVEFLPNWVAGVQAVSRRLDQAIEDISPDDGYSYFIANPGVNDCDVAPQYREGLTEACSRDGVYDSSATVFPRPTRTYMGLVLSLRKRLSEHSQVLASYTLSRTYGDYPGLWAPDNEQLDPNLSSQYDIVSLLPNRLGPLPNDHTHSFKVAGSYEFGGLVSQLKGLTLGLAYHGESGAPYSYLGRHVDYGRLETFILPRGSAGRTPALHTFDATVGYDIPLTTGIRLNLNATVFNLLNAQRATLVDQEYTTDVVAPAAPGTPIEDVRNADGGPVNVNPTFGQPRARQAPLSMRLGARLSF